MGWSVLQCEESHEGRSARQRRRGDERACKPSLYGVEEDEVGMKGGKSAEAAVLAFTLFRVGGGEDW